LYRRGTIQVHKSSNPGLEPLATKNMQIRGHILSVLISDLLRFDSTCNYLLGKDLTLLGQAVLSPRIAALAKPDCEKPPTHERHSC
jgi:hypothetical protein